MLKNFWKDNAHFADLFNAALFDEQPVLDPSILQETDTNLSVVVLNDGQEQTFQREFDVVKKTVHGTDYVLFVLENQQNVHYAMPVRQMFNEALAYYREYADIALRNAKEGHYASSAEYLSKFRETDKLHPIVSLCVYYGDAQWNGPLTLQDMLQLPDHLKHLVTDYKLHLVQLQNNGQLKFHNEDVKTVFELCRLFYDHDSKNLKMLYQNRTVRPDLGIVVGSIVGSQKLINYAKKAANRKETMSMWKSLMDWEHEWEMRGEARGKAHGERIGVFKGIITAYKDCDLSQSSVIEKLMSKHGLSHEEATEYVQEYW